MIPIDDRVAFNSHMGPFKALYDEGKLAVLMGIGYPEPNRSHFRSMDIWHTAEPAVASSEGWLGKTTKAIDPEGKNPVTTVNFGRGLPRALAYPDVSRRIGRSTRVLWLVHGFGGSFEPRRSS